MKAIYPGSFDPITNGHLDIIQRAAHLCSELIVAVLQNSEKQSHFLIDERLDMIKQATENLQNVKVISFEGLSVELCRDEKADCLIRGMRDIGDFRFEWEAAQLNKNLAEIETLFLMTNTQYAFLSSSRIREIAKLGGNVAHWVPESTYKYLFPIKEIKKEQKN